MESMGSESPARLLREFISRENSRDVTFIRPMKKMDNKVLVHPRMASPATHLLKATAEALDSRMAMRRRQTMPSRRRTFP